MEAALGRLQLVLRPQRIGLHDRTQAQSVIWSRFFAVYEPVYALVAEREGKLLGLVHYLFHLGTTSWARLRSSPAVISKTCPARMRRAAKV